MTDFYANLGQETKSTRTSHSKIFRSRVLEKMRKQTIEYTSPLDALVAVAKRLSVYENQYRMNSEDFFHQYSQGKLSDAPELIEWANDYRH